MSSLSELNNRCLAQFLQIYKTETCLWQTKSVDYHNKRKRDESYARLAVKLREMDPAAGIESVQRKINSLRSNFRRELKKVKAARKQGQTYVPQLWYYGHLEFLKPEMLRKPPGENDAAAATAEPSTNASGSASWGGWEPTTVLSPPSPEPTVKREASLDIMDSPEVTTSYSGGGFKRARNDYSEDERRSRHEARDYSDDDERSRNEYSEDDDRGNGYSDDGGSQDSRRDDGDDRREEDEFDLFGRLVVMKLRRLPREQRIIAEKLINDALFLAEMGDLTLQHAIVKGPPNSVPTPIVPITNNRRFSSTLDWACDCTYCPNPDRSRPEYYPICAERNGVQTTFDTWCHFDCENRCYDYTKIYHMFLHRGACVAEPLPSPPPVDFSVAERRVLCRLCGDQCRGLEDPVCARGSSGEFLAFKSRCHMRCHNQCHYNNAYAQFYELHEGDCKWM